MDYDPTSTTDPELSSDMEIVPLGHQLPSPVLTFNNVENTGTINIVVGSQTNQETVPINKIEEWLSADIPYQNYNAARAARLRDTCHWFLRSARFAEWKLAADIFVWIHGSSGCGKTVLSAAIVEDIEYICATDPLMALAYFFFDGRDSQRKLQLHESLIRSLIVQLLVKCDNIPESLKLLYKRYHVGRTQPSIVDLQKTLLDIVSLFRDTYIVIDSLDECTERRAVLTWIQEVTAQKTDRLHLLATSRTEEDIGKRLRSLDSSPTLMTPECVNADIEIYIRHVLENDDAFEQWDEGVHAKLRSALLTSADGMFRLVALQVVELQDCRSEYSLLGQMARSPSGLNEFYDRMLSKVQEKDKEDVYKLLLWLAFSFRPLRLEELVEVTGIIFDSEHGLRFERACVYQSSQSVLNVCSGLVTCTEGIIKLAHMSVKEYLLSSDRCPNFPNALFSHSFIGQTCLAYLLQFGVVKTISDSTVGKAYPLAAYAAENWVDHIELGNAEWSITQQRLIMALFYPLSNSPSSPFITWAGYVDREHDQNLGSPLYYAASYGLQWVVDLLLEKGMDVNAWGGHYGNALQAASCEGHEGVVRLLLEKGANVHAQGGYYGNALQAASAEGCEEIVKLFLEKGADVNAEGGFYGNALQAASAEGSEGIVNLLLENDADVNAPGGYYGTIIGAASVEGHEVIADILLGWGAELER